MNKDDLDFHRDAERALAEHERRMAEDERTRRGCSSLLLFPAWLMGLLVLAAVVLLVLRLMGVL